MDEKAYQNIDSSQNNPLNTFENLTEVKAKKPLNPKLLIIIILAALIFVLLLINLFVSQIRKDNSSHSSAPPTLAPTNTIPSTNDSLIPSPYQNSFKQIEQSLSSDPDLPVPQIDPEIGL